ncbi:MAG: cadherin-like beta sandwich domain-containing protein, partial [Chromatiales bacterium]|nr:cadherin-like beta sandwich domain-containing protein [Chromatiales bacterium]
MIRKLSVAIAIFLIFSAAEAYMPAQPSATFEPKTIQSAREMMYLYPDDATIVLPELSYQEQLEIVDLIAQKDRTYLTIQRDISVNHSNWKLLGTKENFNIWHLHIKSPAAVGMQVLFSEATLTSQLKVKVYSGQNAVTSHIGEYPDIRSQNKEEFWSTSVPGNAIVIEVWAAEDSSLQPNTFPFIIKKINHYFRKGNDDFPALRGFSSESQAQQPSCPVRNDECIADDIGAYRAISQIIYTAPSGDAFSCTGGFLNSSGNSGYYLLTALHCVHPGSSQEMRKGSVINAQVRTSQSVCATADDKLVGNDVRFIAGNGRGDWALLWVNRNSIQRADGRPSSQTNSPFLLGYNPDSLSVGSTLETLHHGNSNRQNYAQAEVTGFRYALDIITSARGGIVRLENCRGYGCTHYSIKALRGGIAGGASGASFWGPRYFVRGVLSSNLNLSSCEGAISRFDKIYEDGRVQCALTDGSSYYPNDTSTCDDSRRPFYDNTPPRLAKLSLSVGELYPSFNSTITAYVATVASDTTQLEVNLQTINDRQKITVNGRSVTTNVAIHLTAETVQTATVTVSTGDNGRTETYTIKIIRLSEQSFEPVGSWHARYENVYVQCLGLNIDDIKFIDSEYDMVRTPSGRFSLMDNDDQTIIYQEASPQSSQPPNHYTLRYMDSFTQMIDGELIRIAATDTITVILSSDEQATIVGVGNVRFRDFSNIPDVPCDISYIIQAQRTSPSSVVLQNLSISPGPLTPSFDSTVKQYTATVDSDTDILNVTPMPNYSGQRITINGTAVSGGGGAGVPLNVGDNTINIVVTSADGKATASYTIIVTRRQPPYLTALTLSTGQPGPNLKLDPSFSSQTMQYTTIVDSDVAQIRLTPISNASGNRITTTANGNPITNNTVPLNVGNNTIIISVATPDGRATARYRLTVTRQMPYLTALTLSSGQLNPSFSSQTMQYTTVVNSDITQIELNPTSNGNGNIIAITANDNPIINNTVPLNISSNTIIISVTTPDDRATARYTLTVTRRQLPYLTALTLSTGQPGPNLKLDPSFSSQTMQYNTIVDSDVTQIRLNLTSNASGNRITMTTNGNPIINNIAPLNVGNNTIIISVATPDGRDTARYTIIVTRQMPYLTALTLSTGQPGPNLKLDPSFSSQTMQYTTTVGSDVTQIELNPTSNGNGNIIAITANDNPIINNIVPLNVSSNTIIISVTTPDGRATARYTIIVTRQMPYLTALTLSTGQPGPNLKLDPSFNSQTMQYTTIVDSDVAQIELNPTSNDNGNIIAITANDDPITNNTVPLNVSSNTIIISV